MATNAIAKIETVQVEGPDGPLTAIMLSLNVADSRSAAEFVQEVAQTFKAHRMCSPPETSGMLVTIVGDLSAEQFANNWRPLAKADKILAQFMDQMTAADVMQGTPHGQMLSSASLLD